MNMMSKIYASTAMSPVELEEQDTTPRTIALPLVTPEVSPALATMIKAYVDAVNSYNSREDDDGAEFDDGGLMERIIAWPAGGYADLGAKMALSLSELRGRVLMTADEVVVEDEFALDLHAENLMIACARDARRLSPVLQGSDGDGAITEAFETYRTAFAELREAPAGLTDEQSDRLFYSRMDSADVTLKSARATTPIGVAMKLRRAFVAIVQDRWSDEAVFDQRSTDFEQGVAMGDIYHKMLWRAIEDLERMAAPIPGTSTSAAGRAEWDQAFAQHEEARAAATAFDEQVATPTYEAWRIAQEAVPHITTTASFESEPGRRTHANTADRAIIGTARMILAELPELARADGDFARTCREAVAADDARQAELERRRLACGYDAAVHRQDELGELESESWKRLIRMPAPDGEALMWKMQELWGDDGSGRSSGWCLDIVEPVLADARRLLNV